MIGKHVIWIARELSAWIFIAALLLSFWGDAGKQRKARAFLDGTIEFAPNRRSYWAWPLLSAYLIYSTIRQVMHIQGRPLNLMIAVSLGILTCMITFPFPGKLLATADGLEQVSWLWKNKRIRWADIVEINTGEKSRTVTIIGADGTKIVHNRRLPEAASAA